MRARVYTYTVIGKSRNKLKYSLIYNFKILDYKLYKTIIVYINIYLYRYIKLYIQLYVQCYMENSFV